MRCSGLGYFAIHFISHALWIFQLLNFYLLTFMRLGLRLVYRNMRGTWWALAKPTSLFTILLGLLLWFQHFFGYLRGHEWHMVGIGNACNTLLPCFQHAFQRTRFQLFLACPIFIRLTLVYTFLWFCFRATLLVLSHISSSRLFNLD